MPADGRPNENDQVQVPIISCFLKLNGLTSLYKGLVDESLHMLRQKYKDNVAHLNQFLSSWEFLNMSYMSKIYH